MTVRAAAQTALLLLYVLFTLLRFRLRRSLLGLLIARREKLPHSKLCLPRSSNLAAPLQMLLRSHRLALVLTLLNLKLLLQSVLL